MTYAATRLLTSAERRLLDFDPNATTLTLVTLDPATGGKCLPLSAGFKRFLVGCFHSVASGVVQAFEIVGATSAAGAGATVVAAHPLTTNPDAVGDTIWLEII